MRTALLQRDREALRLRLDTLAAPFVLPAEHLQVRLTMALIEDAIRRYDLDSPAVDPDRALAAGREVVEDMASKCVELDTVSRASLVETVARGAAQVH